MAVVTKPADQSTDDLYLVAAVRAGDDRAFEQLFLRYQSRIVAYVRGMVRDHERAEDITQEVFISALRRLRATETPIAFKPWIYEIAKNACIDAFRRSRRTNEVSFDADDGLGPSIVARDGAPEAVVDAKLAIDNLCGAFGGLSQTHHDILVMREFEDLTYVEIGDRLGMSRAAVESTLFRARRRLSEEYEELVSGERCVRVRGIVDAPPGRAVGVRDQRRMARHISHCQPCRRYARRAGVDLDALRAPSAATRVAALLPLPAFVRRRFDLDNAGQLLGQHSGPALQWTSKVVVVLDPATVAGWPRAIATAATVAVAGLGAGAVVKERDALKRFVSPPSVTEVRSARSPAATGERSQATPSAHGARKRAPATAGEPGHPQPSTRGSDTAAPVAPAAQGESPVPAAPTASTPASRPSTPPLDDAARNLGSAIPATSLPSADLPSGDVTAEDEPSGKDRPKGPAGKLLEGVGTSIGSGTGPSVGDTLGNVVGTVTGVVGRGGSQGSGAGGAGDGGAETATGSTATDSGAQAGSTLSTTIGQALGGAGAG